MLRTITIAAAASVFAGALLAQTPAKTPAAPKAAQMSAAKPQLKATPKAATEKTVSKPVVEQKSTRSSLKREAKISMATARATALKEVPNGKIHSSELERQNGKAVYSFDIKLAGKPGYEEVNVDAVTGAVLSHQHESSKTEAKEEKMEKKK